MDNSEQTTEKKARKLKEPVVLTRESGKSLLPFARVQKIIKADKEIALVAKDATFLISLATEEFIKRLSESAHRIASTDRRTTVQQKDIGVVVRKADEFVFLEEIMAHIVQEANASSLKRRPKAATESTNNAAPTMLDHFVSRDKAGVAEQDEDEDEDVVMNDDGTMTSGVPLDESQLQQDS